MELNDNSPVIGQPKSIKINMTKYQRAMLYKALSIESSGKSVGFMGDQPGSGKTAVLLALISSTVSINEDQQTVIVLPHNLVSQWEGELEKFAPDLTYIMMNNYSDISGLYIPDNVKNIRNKNIIIVESGSFLLFQSMCKQVGFKVHRVIIDEIDNVENIFEYSDTKKRIASFNTGTQLYESEYSTEYTLQTITWYVSASIVNMIDDNGDFMLSSTVIESSEFNSRLVKCEKAFIDKYSINKYTHVEEIVCECKSIVDKFHQLLSMDQLDNVNSLSFNQIRGDYISISPKDATTVIPSLVTEYYTLIQKLHVDLNTSKKSTARFEDKRLQDEVVKIIKNISFLENIIDKFFEAFSIVDESLSLTENYRIFNKYYSEYVKTFDITNSKQYNITEFFKNLKDNDKVLVFSDHTSGFNIVSKILKDNDLEYDDLGKGNIEEISTAIRKYKSGDTRVLLVDSSSQGCGVNLENTTHIVFLHKTGDTLRDQIVGRALRPGRTCNLKVVTFLNENEIL